MDLVSLGLEVKSNGLQKGVDRLKKLGTEGDRTEGKLRKVAGGAVALATAIAAATGAATAYTVAVSNQVKETQNLANAIGVSVTELQAWQSAAKTVGVSSEALGDIFKDTQDKLGDFIRTGGGEAADMFEQLNLNAQELIALSPDKQLLAIGDAVSQLGTRGEQIFFMEALANDASRLLPLLEDGGAELKALREEALRTGMALSAVDNAALVELSESVSESQRRLQGLGRMFAAELSPAINVAMDAAKDMLGEFDREDIAAFVDAGVRGVGSLADAVHNVNIIASELGAGFTQLGVYVADAMADSADATAAFANLALVPITTILKRVIEQYGDLMGVMASAAEFAGMDALAAGLRQTEARANGAVEGLANLRVSAEGVRGMAEALNSSLERQKTRLEELKAMDPPSERMREAIAAYRAELEASIAEEEERQAALEDSTDSTDNNTRSTVAATKAATEYSTALDELRQRIQPGYSEAQRFAQGMSTINVALATGKISLNEYATLVTLLQDEMHGTGDAAENLGDKVESESERMARSWGGFIDDFVSGSIRSFDDVGDFFADMVQGMVAQAAGNEIKIAMGLPTSGGMSGGFSDLTGGIGSLISGGKSLLGLGSASAASAGGFMGAAATQTAGTLYGSAATGSAIGSAASGGLLSSIGGGLSAAAPWLAGGLAIDSLLGLGITDAIGGLFGSKSRGPSFDLMTTNQDPRTIFEDVQHGVTARGAFGNVGFNGGNTNRLQETFGSFDNARQFLETIAATDDMIAALAPDDVDAMTQAIQQMRLKSSDAEGIVDQLGERTRAAFGAMSGDFGAFARTLTGSSEEIIAQAQYAQQAYDYVTDASESLGLQFDITGGYAYEYAQQLADQAGGLQNLQALTEGYYQSFYSENERLTQSMQSLYVALAAVTDEVPNTVEGMRELIESQRASSGSAGFAVLLQNAGAFAETTGSISDKLSAAYKQFAGDGADVSSAVEQWTDKIATGESTLDDALSTISDSGNAAKQAADAATGAEDERTRSVRRNTDAVRENGEIVNEVTRMLNESISAQQQRANELRASERRITGEAFAGPSAMQQLIAGGADLASLSVDRGDFSSLSEYQREAGRVANRLDAMADDAESNLSVAERQLQRLESIDNAVQQQRLAQQIVDNPPLVMSGRSGDNSGYELVSEIKGLREQVSHLESYNKDTRKYTREQWINQIRNDEGNL